jgi:hypothetical protein
MIFIIAPTDEMKKFYDMAWGKPWPQSRGIISEGDIANLRNNEDIDGPLLDILQVPPSFNYDCFEQMDVLRNVFGRSVLDRALVIREEYRKLFKALEEDYKDRAIIVTGHPGIGLYEPYCNPWPSEQEVLLGSQ